MGFERGYRILFKPKNAHFQLPMRLKWRNAFIETRYSLRVMIMLRLVPMLCESMPKRTIFIANRHHEIVLQLSDITIMQISLVRQLSIMWSKTAAVRDVPDAKVLIGSVRRAVVIIPRCNQFHFCAAQMKPKTVQRDFECNNYNLNDILEIRSWTLEIRSESCPQNESTMHWILKKRWAWNPRDGVGFLCRKRTCK
jgi:hypothetical protein